MKTINKLLVLFLMLSTIAMVATTAAATPSVNLRITSADIGKELTYGTPGDFDIYISPECDCKIEVWAPLSYLFPATQGEKDVTVYEKKDNKWEFVKNNVLTPIWVRKNVNPVDMKGHHSYLVALRNPTSYDTDLNIKPAA